MLNDSCEKTIITLGSRPEFSQVELKCYFIVSFHSKTRLRTIGSLQHPISFRSMEDVKRP